MILIKNKTLNTCFLINNTLIKTYQNKEILFFQQQ